MIGIKRHYTSVNQMVADQARSNYLFRESDYLRARETGTDTDYLLAMANTKDNLDASFDVNVYDRLSDDDRFNYFLHKNYGEKGTENYDKTEEYFNNQIEQIKRQEIYNSLSGFEKTVNSIGGFVGNSVLQLGGIVEGVVDAGTLLVGAAASIFDKEAGQDIKEFISKDATGYGAAQQALNEYINTYTFIDKNGITKVLNDVSTGLVRMTPMIVGNLLTPVTGGVSSVIGNTIYYTSMAGNTAEETIKANPDINYGSLLAYTGASVGLEALTEWASGKIFGDDIVSAMLKGEKYAPTGSIFKNIVKNFTTEGLEEATTELFGSILYNTIVDPTADIASIGDIMYAALIGGLTGAIMSGGQVLTTKKMSVMDGKLVDTSSLTKEQRKTAKNLTKAQSYGLNNLIYQAQQATQQTDEVTKLMSKYGLSLQDVQTEHAEEYQEALEKDTETKTQQAKGILELANLMNTIGVEQFQRSSKLLNEHIEEARTMVNNYLNHSAEYNKAASDAYSAAFDGQSMTPTAQLTNSEQTLVKTLREIYPNLKVAFGTFGSKEGLSVRSIAGTKGWLFIESGLVDKMGYQALLEHAIKNEMTNSMITELEKLPTELSDSLVKIVTEDKTSFKDLSEEQKQTIAQIVCFDPVNNRRIFRSNNKAHSEIFKYITDQANFIKNYARKNDANTLRYRELLKIRNTFFNSIAQTVNNAEDVEFVTNEYKLAQDEVKTKIIAKTSPSILNINRKLTAVNLAKDAILREEALGELLDARNKLDKTTEFDYRRLYDESYYADEAWVNSIKTQQQTNDFETALKQHLVAVYKTSFDDRTNIVTILKNNLKAQDVRNAAKELLTKEFNTNVTDYNVLQNEVVNTLYDMLTTEIDDNTDYIVVEDNTIKGGGAIKFLKVKIDERNNIYNEQQQRRPSESAGEQVSSMVTKSTTIANKVTIEQIDESSYNDRQKEMTVYAEREYGVKLHFYEGSAILDGYDNSVDYGLNGFIYGDNDIYIRYDDTLSESVIERILLHEGTHKLISENKYAYERLLDDLIPTIKNFNTFLGEYKSDDMYGLIYDNESDIIEEVIVDVCCGRITNIEWTTNAYDGIQKIFNFYRDVSHVMYNIEHSFFDENKTLSQQNVREKMRPHAMSNETATWTKERLDKLINRNTSSDNPNRVQAYASYINPHDFVAATTSTARERSTIRMQMRDYDYLGNLADISETPYLRINPITMEIVGHEGRHRMWAMSEAGITEAAVVIYFDTTDVMTLFFQNNIDAANRIYEFVTFKGQTDYNGFGGKENQAFVTFRDMIPLNESHRTDLEKTFVKGFVFKEGPKIRFAKDLSQRNKRENEIISKTKNATSPKQIAEGIASLVANSPIAYSESKGFEGAEMEYTKVAQSMIDENFSLFRKVTQKNYQQIRDEIANTNLPYTEQALLIFDRALFTYAEDSSRFDDATQEKIKNQARQKQTISAQWQGLQSRRFADKTSLTEVKNKFAEQGIDVSVSDDMVAKYVPEIKNKKEFVEQIDKNISEIEQKIETANDALEKAALNKQLKDETDKRIVIEKGTNEEILDWAITNEDIVSRASKIQRDVFEQMVETAELAEKTEGKKALTILVDEKTGLPKPFPKTTQYVQKAVKGLKSFRMWAMLTSPVSWVRNWVGNAGMTALDNATNQFEKFLTNRQPKVDIANLEKQQKALQNKKDLTPTEQAKLAELNAQITRAYDFKFVETTASKDLKKQIAEDYKTVFQQILNGEDVSKYEGSAEKAGAIARAERDITRKSENANFVKKVWAACQSMTDWGLNTGVFGDNAVVLNSLVRNFANMVESNKPYLIKSLTTEYGKDGAGMSDARRALVEKALKSKDSMDIINAMSKADVELFMDSCKQRTFEQYFKNSNWLSKWASNLSQKHPIAASLTSLVLPFPKVAANVLTMAYKYSPLGFISALRQWSVVKQMDAEGYKGYRDAFARAKLNRTTAQATVGTMMCIAGLILASLGFIDIEEDDYMGPSLHIGDLRISLSDLAPSMTTLSVGAGMMWAWKNDKSAVLTALDVLYDNTLLGNIENVFKYGSPDKYIVNLSINYVSQYVPAMLKLFTKLTTNQEMIDKSGTYFEKLWKTFGSGIPGIAHMLPKRVNPYTGEFLTSTGSQNVFFNFIEALSPLDFETTVKSPTQKEAERLNTKTTGLSGTFKVNDTEYVVDKVTYSKYRADYIQTNFEQILSGKQKVTVEDDNGKRITTTYDKLNDKQKKNVIDRLYTEATSITKIKWWTDLGNKYVVTNEDQYKQYRTLFDTRNIVYKEAWNKSKFMER